jgi:SNF2 family DNA or RNA helicase
LNFFFLVWNEIYWNIFRRDFNVLRRYLPEKYEYVVKIYMGDLQKQLYNKYLEIQNIDPTGLFFFSVLIDFY